MSNSVSLHRILKASQEKVFRAFTDATAIASWLPPYAVRFIPDGTKIDIWSKKYFNDLAELLKVN
jgi:uncharacterized protein YndB with AHSA1/START domain